MLDVEAALARAQAGAGLHRRRATRTRSPPRLPTPSRFDARRDRRRGGRDRQPGRPARAGADGARSRAAAAGHVHAGATSQDILDTAAMLVAAPRARRRSLDDLDAAADAAARARRGAPRRRHGGRTLLQQALPITFGLKAAGWLAGLDEARGAAGRGAARRASPCSSAAPPGRSRRSATPGRAVARPPRRRARARRAGAAVAHDPRRASAELAGALGAAAGVVGKAGARRRAARPDRGRRGARGRPGRGGSSTMPHKRNPVAAISARRPAPMRAPGLVATLLGAMAHEHERAAGRVARRVAAARRPARGRRLGRGVAARLPRATSRSTPRACARTSTLTGGAAAGRARDDRAGAGARPPGGARARRAAAREAFASGRPLADVAGRDGPRSPRASTPTRSRRLLDPAGYLGATDEFDRRALARPTAIEEREPCEPVDVPIRIDGPADAPPVVLSNSLGTTQRDVGPAGRRRSRERFRVVRYDTRGHGASPVPPGPYSLDDLGGDVLALLDRLGVERAHVGGLSLGGMTGMWLAANAPERVDRLVAVCTSAMLGRRSTTGPRGRSSCASRAPARSPTAARALVHARVRDARPGHACAKLRAMLADTPAEGYAGCCEAIAGDGPARRDRRPSPRRRSSSPGARTRRPRREHAERIAAAHPRRPARARRRARTWRTSSSADEVTAAHPRPPGGGDERRRSATRRACGVRREVLGDAHVDRAIAEHDRVHRAVPGLHHPRRLGRRLVARRPGPPHAQHRHAGGADRARARERDRDARPRGAISNGLSRRPRSPRCCSTPRSTPACRRRTRRSRSPSGRWPRWGSPRRCRPRRPDGAARAPPAAPTRRRRGSRAAAPASFCAWRSGRDLDDVPGEAEPSACPPISAAERSISHQRRPWRGRARERVVVVVPGLAERRRARARTRWSTGPRRRSGGVPKKWQTELIDQVTWCSRKMRTKPPQSRPVQRAVRACRRAAKPSANGIARPSSDPQRGSGG